MTWQIDEQAKFRTYERTGAELNPARATRTDRGVRSAMMLARSGGNDGCPQDDPHHHPSGSYSPAGWRHDNSSRSNQTNGDDPYPGVAVKFEIRKSNSSTQPYYWRIVASNGQVLAVSETYVRKTSAQSAIESVKANARSASVVDLT